MRNFKNLKERLKKLQSEIRAAEQEKIKEIGKISLSIFKKESDFSDENFLKFKEKLIELLNKFQ